MTPHYADEWLTVYHGDARAVLAELPAESVHCVVTSPPYWGLRDYGTASWIGGDEACDHKGKQVPRRDTASGQYADFGSTRGSQPAKAFEVPWRETCGKCGAIRQDSQLGLEPTPEQYVENMVAVFREVRRVLRSDGTVWLNLGDSYFGDSPPRKRSSEAFSKTWDPANTAGNGGLRRSAARQGALKPKDLIGIPWRVAFALQADGWYLRSDIIWSKPNPMPESVTDRPTKSHEYLFLLSKSARYYYDADAVREGALTDSWPGIGPKHGTTDNHKSDYNPMTVNAGRNLRSVWSIATAPYPGAHFATFPPKLVEPCIKAGTSEKGVCPECGAPWVREVERVGVREQTELLTGGKQSRAVVPTKDGVRAASSLSVSHSNPSTPIVTTTGWRPSCGHRRRTHEQGQASTSGLVTGPVSAPGLRGGGGHPASGSSATAGPLVSDMRSSPDQQRGDAETAAAVELTPVPATVLDPFAGSGTTGMVAQSLSRRAILIDLSLDYLGQLMDRNREVPLGL